MNNLNKPLVTQYEQQTHFFTKALEGIKEDDRQKTLTDDTNHLAWLAGHIVSCRFMLAQMMGLQVSEPYPTLFANLKGIDLKVGYPPLQSLQKDWPAISEKLTQKLGELSDEALLGKAPMGDGSLMDIVVFFAHHEAYHIGQLGFLRKCLGYQRMNHFE